MPWGSLSRYSQIYHEPPDQGILKGEVSLYHWPPVWLVWISLFLKIKTKIVCCHTADSKPVKQEVNGTVIFPPLVFPGCRIVSCHVYEQNVIKMSLHVQFTRCNFAMRLMHTYGLKTQHCDVSVVATWKENLWPGNTKGGSFTVPLTSCLTGLD